MLLHSAKELQGYAIHARDGDLGKVQTFYFDDHDWGIHYLVVQTGSWFSSHYVLLPVDVLGQPVRETQGLSVTLTQEEVRQSPEVPNRTSTSTSHETAMRASGGHNVYWSTDPFVLNSVAARPASVPIPTSPPARTHPQPADMQGAGAPLRSTREVLDYYIQATDGEIGHVEDFLIDPDTWHIRYMVVDTRNWLPGRKVLVFPKWINQIRWDERKVDVDLTRDLIKNSPEFDPDAPLDRAYEGRLFDFYDRPRYWRD
jgi:hypothetical protein